MSRDSARLHEALRKHLLAGDAIRAVTPLSTGHSNETYLLEGLEQILRLPPVGAALLDSLNMALQFQLFAVLGRLPGAPPVPRVIYYCDDVRVLGAPFYLVERAAGAPFGDYAPADWVVNASESFRGELSLQYVQAIAALSKLQPLDMLGPVKTPREECLRWRGFARKGGHELLATLLDRLIAAEPPRSGPPALVHGDPKMSNILWLDGRLQSVLDWELAFNGEPLSDLGYMLTFFASDVHPAGIGFDLPGMWKRQQIISEWERVAGRPADGIEWFEAAAAAKITAITVYGYHLARTNQVADARMLTWLPFVNEWVANTERLVQSLE
jgi:aminoglycoside phosphotransferase (APT) family kinase protein